MAENCEESRELGKGNRGETEQEIWIRSTSPLSSPGIFLRGWGRWAGSADGTPLLLKARCPVVTKKAHKKRAPKVWDFYLGGSIAPLPPPSLFFTTISLPQNDQRNAAIITMRYSKRTSSVPSDQQCAHVMKLVVKGISAFSKKAFVIKMWTICGCQGRKSLSSYS